MDILLNNQKINISETDFPILISGAEKSGASFFSICLLADLLKNGMKVLLFSAYPAAKEEFGKQANANLDRAIIIESGEEQAFIKTIQTIPDLSDRVILIKNIDNYSRSIFEVVKNLKFVIFSGDLDKCQFADELMKINFNTKIFFSDSKKYAQTGLLALPKYCGQIFSTRYNGIITLGAAK